MARQGTTCPAAFVVLHRPKAASNDGASGRGIAGRCLLLPEPMVLPEATHGRCRSAPSRPRQTTHLRLASATPSEITRGPRGGNGSGRTCRGPERMAAPLRLKCPPICTTRSLGKSRSVTRVDGYRCPLRVACPQWAGCPRRIRSSRTRISMPPRRRRRHSNRTRPPSLTSSRSA